MSGLDTLLAETAQRYQLDPATFRAIAQIESGLNPAARNPRSSAGGLFQFIDSTWNQYGRGDRSDPTANADAAGRYLTDVRNTLRNALGRDPTPGELYLGHQQGATGASNILSNPDAPAAMTVGTRAVLQNGGNQGMSNRDFAGLWSNRLAAALGRPQTAVASSTPTLPFPTVRSASGAPQPTQDEALRLALSASPQPQADVQQNRQRQASLAQQRLELLGVATPKGLAGMF